MLNNNSHTSRQQWSVFIILTLVSTWAIQCWKIKAYLPYVASLFWSHFLMTSALCLLSLLVCFFLVLNWTASQCFIHQQTLPFATGHIALTRVTDARWQPNIDWRPTYSLVCQGLKVKVTLHVSPANIHSIFNSTEVCKMNKFKHAFPDLVPSLAGNNHLLFNFNLQIYMVDHLKHCEMEMLLS